MNHVSTSSLQRPPDSRHDAPQRLTELALPGTDSAAGAGTTLAVGDALLRHVAGLPRLRRLILDGNASLTERWACHRSSSPRLCVSTFQQGLLLRACLALLPRLCRACAARS